MDKSAKTHINTVCCDIMTAGVLKTIKNPKRYTFLLGRNELMRLRSLELMDAEPMLEWMHDQSVVEKLQTNFAEKTIDDCRSFIEHSQDEENIHLAITDDDSNYMGTVSLKHITKDTAEFAITISKKAMGKGYSIWAMHQIIDMAFQKYNVSNVYWCVATGNLRALRFYDKNNFPRVSADAIKIAGGYTKEQIDSYVWYQVSRSEGKS